jgi:uncharacterized membrane protein YqjE
MTPPDGNRGKDLGEIVAEVSEKASLLVREEIELAKAEVTDKAKTFARGAAVAGAAGVFLALGLIYLLHAVAYFFFDLLDTTVWVGYLIVVALLVLGAFVAARLAKKWLSPGPPTPDMAIEEAKITRQTLERQAIHRDQLGRSGEAGR